MLKKAVAQPVHKKRDGNRLFSRGETGSPFSFFRMNAEFYFSLLGTFRLTVDMPNVATRGRSRRHFGLWNRKKRLRDQPVSNPGKQCSSTGRVQENGVVCVRKSGGWIETAELEPMGCGISRAAPAPDSRLQNLLGTWARRKGHSCTAAVAIAGHRRA